MIPNILLVVILSCAQHIAGEKRVLLHGSADITQDVQSLHAQVQILQSQVANLTKIVTEHTNGGQIAFSAILDHLQRHTGLGQVIKFNKVLLNIGHAYEPNTGVFTAPRSGVYQFVYFLGYAETDQSQTWIRLMKSGTVLNAAVVDQMHSSQDVQGGNAAIVQLKAHETVWIETWHENNAEIHGQYGFTSFSGFLL